MSKTNEQRLDAVEAAVRRLLSWDAGIESYDRAIKEAFALLGPTPAPPPARRVPVAADVRVTMHGSFHYVQCGNLLFNAFTEGWQKDMAGGTRHIDSHLAEAIAAYCRVHALPDASAFEGDAT